MSLIRALASAAMAVISGGALLTGCAGAPDRKAEARQLQAALTTTAGVAHAYVHYENSFGRGSVLDVSVSVPAATGEQIAAVADTINRIRGAEFDKFDQSFEFFVEPAPHKVVVGRSARLDGAELGRDAVVLRRLASHISAADISWRRGADPTRSSLRVIDLRSPISHTLNVIRADLGADAVLTADLRPERGSQAPPLWTVHYPFSAAQQADIEGRLASMPGKITAVTIESDARISVLTVAMDEHSDEDGGLRAVIAAAGAGPDRPMWLRWVARGGSASGPHGFVVVGACNYPAQTGQRPGSAAEQQLRREFDTCPR